MLSLLPLVVALASNPSPSPAPASTARPTPLTEIGRVRTTPICTTIVVHANGAITSALDNDRTLAILTTNLRNTDFDRLNSLQRRNAIEDLMKQASAVRINGKLADNEIKQLRAYAQTSTDPERKAELKAFADALGGAIYRQTKVANEFMRDVTIVQGREEAKEVRDIRNRDNPPPESAAMMSMGTQRAGVPDPPRSYNQVMRAVAADLTDLQTGIIADEGVAADHSIAATSGC
jgi:predicted DNA binding protein